MILARGRQESGGWEASSRVFERALALIQENQRFLISGHVDPDGDCLGTQAALYHFLLQSGKQATIINPGLPEPVYGFLAEHTPFGVLGEGDKLPEHDVHVLTDCSTLDRTGCVGQAAQQVTGVQRLVIDHHVGGDQGDGDVLLWDPEAPSSGSLIYDLFRKGGMPMSPEAAEGVFVSIVADTGWFRYSNTTDGALAIAADLVVHGVKPHLIYNAMYRSRPVETVDLLAQGLARTRFEADGRVAVCELPVDYVTRAERCGFHSDVVLDQLRSVEGVDVVMILKARTDGRVKISLRASDRVDVDGVARELGGGGHRKAAGAEMDGPLEAAVGVALGLVLDLVR